MNGDSVLEKWGKKEGSMGNSGFCFMCSFMVYGRVGNQNRTSEDRAAVMERFLNLLPEQILTLLLYY